MACVLATLILASASAAAARPGSCQACARSDSARAMQLIEKINQVRRQSGLRKLSLSPALEAAADSHDRQMLSIGYFGHASADGTPCWRRIERWYPPRAHAAWDVEEALLAANPDVSPSTALVHWLASKVHRRILLDPAWRNIGVAIVHAGSAPGAYRGKPTTVITADFGVR